MVDLNRQIRATQARQGGFSAHVLPFPVSYKFAGFGWYFVEENFLQTNSGNRIQYYTQDYKERFPDAAGTLITDISERSIALTSGSSLGFSRVRIDWEQSENCGGSNGLIQNAEVRISNRPSFNGRVDIRIEGKGEVQDRFYERMLVNLYRRDGGFDTILEATSPGGEGECGASQPVIFFTDGIDNVTTAFAESSGFGVLSILDFSDVSEIVFEFSTVDFRFHVGAYYDLQFSVS
jgi:hypothetical protein